MPEGKVMRPRWNVGASLLGGGLGFTSGVLGIGGGVLLAPLLFLGGRLPARRAAVATAFFIFVNSLAGLAGQVAVGGRPPWPLAAYLLLAVLLGGACGSHLALRHLPGWVIRRLAATLVILVGIRLLILNYW